jgi:hypothetical protein
MVKNFRTRFARLATELEKQLPPSSSVFLCAHKDNAHIAKHEGMSFDGYSVGHWGAVDGRNDWQDFDTAVIFGLPYRDQVWANNTFFAAQGLQSNEWLRAPAWKGCEDVRREMSQRQLSVSVIQAINRIRLRRVVDAGARCPEANIFIVLPKDSDGEAILGNIRADTPGLGPEDSGLAFRDGRSEESGEKPAHPRRLTIYLATLD